MGTVSCDALAPSGVRGMKVLDRDRFTRDVSVPILKVSEVKLSCITRVCKPYFLKLENFKPVQNSEDASYSKHIHLNPDKVKTWTDIASQDRDQLANLDVDSKNFDNKTVQLNYTNWRVEQIFKSVLPEGEESVSGFSQIGHIIHLNLREHLIEYKLLIGQVLVDKIKTCQTVVNKSNIIDNTYRNFSMEVIAGNDNFMVEVKENRCSFKFDFSKVYWNPRLGKEHERILSYLKTGDILFDVFCGVGPFAIPAVKKKCRVFANDLNPDSYKWLNHNAKTNKLDSKLFQPYNLDGKDFLQNIFKQFLIDLSNGVEMMDSKSRMHITMNLPALAVEFLKHFNGLLDDVELKYKLDVEIIVYVYCFITGENLEEIKQLAIETVNKNIGCDISKDITELFDVRNVSPKKEMMRVTINLKKDVLFGMDNTSEPPSKKKCDDISRVKK